MSHSPNQAAIQRPGRGAGSMTICLVSPDYPPENTATGIGTQTYLKATALAARGHAVHVIASTYGESSYTTIVDGVTVHRLRHPVCDTLLSETAVLWVGYSWMVATKIRDLAEEVRFDLIEFPEYGAPGFIYQTDAAAYPEVPTATMLHGSLAMFAERIGWPGKETEFYHFGTFMEERVIRLADVVLSASHNIAKFWADRCSIPLHQICVVHTAVDADRFVPRSKTGNRPTVLFVGRLDPAKGLFTVAEAVMRLRRKYPAIRLRVVGSGEPDAVAFLHQLADRYDASQNLELAGPVPYADLPVEYAAADVFAAPSPQEHGLASVYLEALACACPVIACNTGGSPEVIEDGVTGLLVEPENPDAVARALDRLLSDAQLRERLGRSGRAVIDDYFNATRLAERVERAYRLAIATYKGRVAQAEVGCEPA